jgi:hypothetical protein
MSSFNEILTTERVERVHYSKERKIEVRNENF